MSEVKISELEETSTVQDGGCLPIVTSGVTKKITYGTLVENLNTVIEPEWTKIKNKPSTYTPSTHTHSQSDVNGLDTALKNKQDKLTAGSGITIENNVISTTGGGTGGGAVNSVNGKTGTVVLIPSDIGAVATEEGKGLSTNDYDDTEKQNNASNTATRHSHSNKSILDNTTASYTMEEKTKLVGIETGAEVNTVDSVNGKTGVVNLNANDVGAMSASTVVTTFWKGTQSEYDALISKDTTTLYLIKEG